MDQKHGDSGICRTCSRIIEYYDDGRSGGWWAHRVHPSDGHVAHPLDVTPVGDGGYVVRGTTDVITAKRAVQRHRLGEYYEPRDAIRMEPVQHASWLRWNPCNERSCYEGWQAHIGHLAVAKGKGSGNWQGVYFQEPL